MQCSLCENEAFTVSNGTGMCYDHATQVYRIAADYPPDGDSFYQVSEARRGGNPFLAFMSFMAMCLVVLVLVACLVVLVLVAR